MCIQLDRLSQRLRDPQHVPSRFDPPERPAPISVATSLTGTFGPNGIISLASPQGPEESSRLKLEWNRSHAPMLLLHQAIESLLGAFWAQQPSGEDSLSAPVVQHLVQFCSSRDRKMTTEHLRGPAQLVFLQKQAPRLDWGWNYIPIDLQGAVLQHFRLFCFELSELGYKVSQMSGRSSSEAWSIAVAHWQGPA